MIGTIALSAGGRRIATWIAVNPPYEMPHIPTFPSHHGWAASQATASTPSSVSSAVYSSSATPPDEPVPRTSTRHRAYPRAANHAPRAWSAARRQLSLPYGMSSRIAGCRARLSGRQMFADSSIPSRTRIRASQSTVTSKRGALAERSRSVIRRKSRWRWGRPRAEPIPCDHALMEDRFVRRSRRGAYRNAWIIVWHDEVDRPDGSPGIYGVVHFANVAAGVVAIDDEDRIVLVGQHRYTLDTYSWEIPEGGVPAGESPIDGARRGLREETGLEAAHWDELLQVELSNSVSDERAVLFFATDLHHGLASPDPTEALAVRWVPFDEALAMTTDGRITDVMSVVAIQRVALDRRAARRG